MEDAQQTGWETKRLDEQISMSISRLYRLTLFHTLLEMGETGPGSDCFQVVSNRSLANSN